MEAVSSWSFSVTSGLFDLWDTEKHNASAFELQTWTLAQKNLNITLFGAKNKILNTLKMNIDDLTDSNSINIRIYNFVYLDGYYSVTRV